VPGVSGDVSAPCWASWVVEVAIGADSLVPALGLKSVGESLAWQPVGLTTTTSMDVVYPLEDVVVAFFPCGFSPGENLIQIPWTSDGVASTSLPSMETSLLENSLWSVCCIYCLHYLSLPLVS
jgi:hypothetical protein